MAERLQKLISAAHICSRRKAEVLISAGRVTVNGVAGALGQRADPMTDDIRVDGRPLRFSDEKTYLLLHKPRNFLTTLSDDRGRPTVAELVRDAGVRVYPAGRLDFDSEGLLLLTDDGPLAQALTHPSHRVDKVYRVEAEGDIQAALPLLSAPMVIDGVRVGPAAVRRLAGGALEIIIHEGRNRQVRKMCAQAGLTVRRLIRVAEGPLRLGELPPGKWRRLTEGEIAALRALAFPGKNPENLVIPEKI